MGSNPRYDLEDRLLAYAADVIRLVEILPSSRAGNHAAGQLLRCGTSPLANHGEAEAAESRADFIHKMNICLKELRETLRWLRLVQRVPLIKPASQVDQVLRETDELIRIFFASIRTAEANERKERAATQRRPSK
jgi:four helix bundle protein